MGQRQSISADPPDGQSMRVADAGTGPQADRTPVSTLAEEAPSPTIALAGAPAAADVRKLTKKMEVGAFTKMVSFIDFSYSPTSRQNRTLIGYHNGGDQWMGNRQDENKWKAAAEAGGFDKNYLYKTTTVDFQTNISARPGEVERAQLQLQMGSKPNRFAAACVILPYKQPAGARPLSVRMVRNAFLRSQERQQVIDLSNFDMCELDASEDDVLAMELLKGAGEAAEPPAEPLRPELAALPVKLQSGAGWRTMWSDFLRLGQGFHRETGGGAAVGIKYSPQQEPKWACQVKGVIKVISSAEEFVDMATSGGAVSFEGWGASAEATLSAVRNMKFSTKTLTGTVSMRFLSEKIIMIDTASNEQDVQLTTSARELLENAGPEEFHRVFGTHFVSGYTKGGYFLGSFIMQFESAEHALANMGAVKAGFERFGLKAEGEAEFKRLLEDILELTSYHGEYTCDGWSSEHPPKAVCSLEDLVEAHDQFNMQNGRAMEAILQRYSDIDSYRTARATYFEKQSMKDPGDIFMQEDNYGTLSSALNNEYMRYYYLYRLLEDATEQDNELFSIRRDAEEKMKSVRRKFRTADVATVRHNWRALEAFLLQYNAELTETQSVLPEESDLWFAGRALHAELWQADSLLARLAAELPDVIAKPPTRIPKALGGGWTVDTSDGHLRFKYNGDQKLVVHNPENGNRIWCKELEGYLTASKLLKDGDKVTIRNDRNGHRLQQSDDFTVDVAAVKGWHQLQRPATFANTNRGGWECMVLEKMDE